MRNKASCKIKKGPSDAVTRVCAFIGEQPRGIMTCNVVIKVRVREVFQESGGGGM